MGTTHRGLHYRSAYFQDTEVSTRRRIRYIQEISTLTMIADETTRGSDQHALTAAAQSEDSFPLPLVNMAEPRQEVTRQQIPVPCQESHMRSSGHTIEQEGE